MGKDRQNIHKFVSFTERISKLRIDVVHKIEKRTETPDVSETFFQQSLRKWSDLNCSLDFQEFTKEVSLMVKSLSLLVYHQKAVVEILQRYLKKKDSLALDALFELTVQLSRDLQSDFSIYFPEFLKIIARHLDTKDAQKIEDCFKTLAYLFKFQWRHLVNNMKPLFRLYSPLLTGNQAAYLHQFAAESFAFLLRKTKDLSGLLDDIFKTVVEEPRLCHGIGQLFAETVRGVQHQFHSCAEKVLTILLDKLRPDDFYVSGSNKEGKIVFEVFVYMFTAMAKYTLKEHTQVAWKCLIDAANKLLTNHDSDDRIETNLNLLVLLINVWVGWKAGDLILHPLQLYKMISSLTKRQIMEVPLKNSILKITSSLLLANSDKLKDGYNNKMLHHILNSEHFNITDICQFARHLKEWSSFTTSVLPKLVAYFESALLKSLLSSEQIKDILFLFAEIVVEKISFEKCFGGSYSDDISMSFLKLAAKKGPAWFNVLFPLDYDHLDFGNEAENLWASLVCLPFVRPIDFQFVSQSIVKLISQLHGGVKNSSEKMRLWFIISQAVKCLALLCLSQNRSLGETLGFDTVLSFIRHEPGDIHVLQICKVYLSIVKRQQPSSQIFSTQNLLIVYPYIERNLASHQHLVRLLTLKILAEFDQLNMEANQNTDYTDTMKCNVFQDCLDAELVPLSFTEYRQKFIFLQKLVYFNTQHLPEAVRDAPLRYLIGVLYVNLSTMWVPVMSMIATHAVSQNKKRFWNVFHEYLSQASLESAETRAALNVPEYQPTSSSLEDLFQHHLSYCTGQREDNRVDYTNFRLLLWKTMQKFPEIVEPCSKQVVPLFLEFFRKECSLINEDHKVSYENITTTTSEGPTELTDNDLDTTAEGQREKTSQPLRMKTLSACLLLLSKFKNPRRLYQEQTMKEIYLTLLTQKDGEIQKLAFDCLMTYKPDYLVPYKENMDRLFEDKTFKDELTSFSSNEELNVVRSDHRAEFIKILIRILYGKMQRWTGSGTRGKSGSSARRSLILRFLNNCSGDEMIVFIQLISQPFQEIIATDSSLVKYSLNNIVPLRKQLGYLNMFCQIIEMLGAKAEQHLAQMLEILFYCLKISNNALQLTEKFQVQPKHRTNLKAVRQLGIKCLIKFVDAFPLYDYGSIIDTIYDLVVWPQIGRISSESLQSPTPLLQLLHVWTKNPRFFPPLSRVYPPGTTHGLLSHVFACLSSDHVQTPVVAMVMEMADNLLSQSSLDSDSKEHNDLMDYGSEMSYDLPSNGTIAYGTRLILPHVSTILAYLSNSVKKTAKDLSKAKGKLSKVSPVSKLELSVLSKISPFIVDPGHSLTLIRLILPILNATRKEDLQLGMLKSVTNLLKNVDDTKTFFAPLSRLFSTLHHRDARAELCCVFSSISEKYECLSDKVKLLHALNSWNKRQLDEPDFEARLDAFSELCKMVQDRRLDADLTVPFLLNATYYAMRTTDVALRYSATSFVRAVVHRVSEDESGTWFDVLILGSILPAIREAAKSRQEAARNEFVLILGDVVKRFDHPIVADLKPLISDDPEVDFFENIVHIQVHRRIRALRRFTSTCEETRFSAHTLSLFILPLVTHFIYEYKSAKDHNIVSEAINAISAASNQLPWHKYSNLLRHYLRILPREKDIQKVIVRIVVGTLESFHFDLTGLQDKNSEASQDSKKSNEVNEVDENQEENEEEDTEDMDQDESKECPLKLQLKIHETITTRILPQLQKCLTKKIDSNDFHRLSGRKENDEEEMLRVPIVLAMVKLLQSLPMKTLQSHLPGLLLRICQALKSRAFEVRETARGTLSKITNSLGIYYFPFILNELQTSLLRGYQLHVLGSTLHYLLNKLEEHIPAGGLDASAKNAVEILVNDLFGEPAREREVDKIATKLPEAKSTKSFETFEILAKKISTSHLMAIITPLKEVLDQTQSHKISQRVEEILRRISVGLQKNPLFSPEQMLLFVHGLVNEKLPLLTATNREEEENIDDQDPRLSRPDTYIIPSNPQRNGKTPEVHHKSNTHVLLSFGLQLLLTGLKRQKLLPSDEKHIQMLDPFVAVLTEALHSKHVKITTLALRSLCWVVKFPLPSLRDHVVKIASHLFKLLKVHARTGGVSGENYEMVLSAFKTITVLIRDFVELKVTERQLRILLTFVEEDIHDYNRQSSAFPLLRAILSRKLQVAEINDVMLKVAELSVTDDSSSVRLQCRQVLLQFLLDYPLGKKLRRYLEFFISQLEYEHASGRESTLEMLITIITSFPDKTVYNHSGLFFLPLCTRLVNDDSTNCRKLAAVTIKTLLGKLDVERRDGLFGIVLTWLNETKISLRRLATHVCGLFVEVESQTFDRRLPVVLPLLFEIIKPENYTDEETSDGVMEERPEEGGVRDHLLINSLIALIKIIEECPSSKEKMTSEAWDSISSHLVYPHSWVRLMSSRLFGLLFSHCTPQELVLLSKEDHPSHYLAIDLNKGISVLCEYFLSQLKQRSVNEELGEQVVKNLFYLGKLMVLVEKQDASDKGQFDKGNDGKDDNFDGVNLQWLLDNMCNIAKYEASQTPKLSQKRLCVLRWIAAIGSYLGAEDILPYITQMLKPVYRELDGAPTYICENVRSLCQEVAELFKNLVGREGFSHAYSIAKQSAIQTREKRKVQDAFEAVANPEGHVVKKMKRNLAKKESRKRKR